MVQFLVKQIRRLSQQARRGSYQWYGAWGQGGHWQPY